MKTEVEIDIDEDEIKENICGHEKPTKLEIICGLLTGTLFIVAIITYLLIGFLAGAWHPAWVVFLAPIVISSLVIEAGK